MKLTPRLVILTGLAIPSLAFAQEPKSDAAEPPPPPPPVSERLVEAGGFRGMKFGAAFEEFSGLELASDRGKLKLYTKKDDDAKLGPAVLSEIVYYFFDGKLLGVGLHTADGQDSSTLLRILQAAYGPGIEPESEEGTFLWTGKNVSARFTVNETTGEGESLISSNALAEACHQYETDLVNEAAESL